MTPATLRRRMEDRGFSPEEIEDAVEIHADEWYQDRIDRALEENNVLADRKGEPNADANRSERPC